MQSIIQNVKILSPAFGDELQIDGEIVVEGDHIVHIGASGSNKRHGADGTVFNARGCIAVPGFIQTHIHVCQTLFRGLCDDLKLLDWLQQRIFPFESAHTEQSMYASALVAVLELIRSGTTTILDMGSIRHEESIIRALGESGMRAFVGKAMMDVNDLYPALRESTGEALKSTRSLADQFHNSFNGRIRYAPAPRFVLSCTEKLLRETGELVEGTEGMLLHTHASEQREEIELVRSRSGMENIEYLQHLGLLSAKTCLAHCIHVNDTEVALLASTRTSVAHCPSSNLKLGSGLARVPHLMRCGVNVSLGADGAPNNNTLDVFQEMRLASLLQKPLCGPTSMPAKAVFEMSTINGARALGLEQQIGTLEVGKKADIVLLNLDRVWNPLLADHADALYSAITYSASPENVDSVMIDGEWLYQNGGFTTLDEENILQTARTMLRSLRGRI